MDCTETNASCNSSLIAGISVAVKLSAMPLLSNGHLFWPCYSAFQASCHNIYYYYNCVRTT
jgi:hypothetical protein